MAPKAITISLQASKCSPETHNATKGGRREKKKRAPDLFTTNKLYSRRLLIPFLFFFLSRSPAIIVLIRTQTANRRN